MYRTNRFKSFNCQPINLSHLIFTSNYQVFRDFKNSNKTNKYNKYGENTGQFDSSDCDSLLAST